MSNPMPSSTNSFFKDYTGAFSSGRLLAFIIAMIGVLSLLNGMALGWFCLMNNFANSSLPAIYMTAGSSVSLGALGFAGWHKSNETKAQISDNEAVGQTQITGTPSEIGR